MKTISWKFTHGVMVLVHGESKPADDEWSEYMRYAKGCVGGMTGSMVFTDNVGPDARQRADVQHEPRFKNIPVAVVTQSMAVRGIVTAISWFGNNIKSFTPQRIDEAFEYVKLDKKVRDETMTEVARMRSNLVADSNLLEMRELSDLPDGVETRNYVLSTPMSEMRKRMVEVSDRMKKIRGEGS